MTTPASPFDVIARTPPPSQKTVYLSFVGPVSEINVQTLMARVNVEIQGGATTVHLFISSYGGLVAPAFAAYGLLKGLPVELITHNSGNVGSAGVTIFLAGGKRYATPSATFYFHGTTGGSQGLNAAGLQSAIDSIDIDNERTVELIRRETGAAEIDVRALITSVGVTRNAQGALEAGLIHEIRDVVIPAGASFFQLILNH